MNTKYAQFDKDTLETGFSSTKQITNNFITTRLQTANINHRKLQNSQGMLHQRVQTAN